MNLVRRLIIACTLLALLVVPLGGAVLASHGGAHAQQNYHCGSAFGNPPVRAYLYENSNTDHGDGDDRLAVCFFNTYGIADLGAISHSPAGGCADEIPGMGSPNWGNCLSSWQLNLPTGYIACIYAGTNYVNFNQSFPGDGLGWSFQFNLSFNDTASSFRVRSGSTC